MASTAYVTFTVPTTVQIPRIITPETDPQTADDAVRAFSGVSYSWHNHQDGDGVLATRDTIQGGRDGIDGKRGSDSALRGREA